MGDSNVRHVPGFGKSLKYRIFGSFDESEADHLLVMEKNNLLKDRAREDKRRDARDADRLGDPTVKEADMILQGGKGALKGALMGAAIIGFVALMILVTGGAAAIPAVLGSLAMAGAVSGFVLGGAKGAVGAYNKEHAVEHTERRIAKLEKHSDQYVNHNLRKNRLYVAPKSEAEGTLNKVESELLKKQIDPITRAAALNLSDTKLEKERAHLDKVVEGRKEASLYSRF